MLFMSRSQFDKSLIKARNSEDEQIDCIREARMAWEHGINDELKNISLETNKPYSSIR